MRFTFKNIYSNLLLILHLCIPGQTKAQNDTLLSTPWLKLNTLPFSTDMELDEEGNIYLLESKKHKLHKVFAQNGYDSILSIGGKGISGEGLNQPVKIRATNRQAIYCLDLMNRRLIVFNTNLRILREVNFFTLNQNEQNQESGTQIWPQSFEVAPTGDLFILNQEDNRILKMDVYGKLQTSFGGLDYGRGSLINPADMSMNEDNLLFVSDTTAQTLQVFDLFGVYKYSLVPPDSFRFKGFCLLEKNLLYFNDSELCLVHLMSGKVTRLNPMLSGERILDVHINRKLLAILTEKQVILYPY